MDEKKETDNNSANIPEHQKANKKNNLTDKFRENPWILATFVFGVIILILLLGGFNLTGKVISQSQAEQGFLSLASQQLTNIKVTGIEKQNPFYKIDYTADETRGTASSVYVTLDGKYLVLGLLPLISNTNTPSSSSSKNQQTTVPKTSKPNVELYVFAYCPYGLQMEKAMIPVVKLLGSKIDFKIRQIGAMHGDFEKVEAQRQLCIEKNYPEQYLDYVLAFDTNAAIGKCQSDAYTQCGSKGDSCISPLVKICVAPLINALFSNLGMDASKINSCMTADGLTMYNAEVANANKQGVSGSPTLIINGVNSQASRSPDGVLTAVCSAFTASPSECSQKLSATQAAAGFGTGSSGSASGVQCGR